MKVAICGSGPLAIEMSLSLHNLGASVTMFAPGKLGGGVRTLAGTFPKRKMKSPLQSYSSYGEYFDKYLNPLAKECANSVLIKPFSVSRIQKKFLSPAEEIPNRKRLADMFRVIYSVNPAEALNDQLATSPEMFQGLDANILKSLKESIENYEDFDIVIDATGLVANPLGSSQTFALNEKLLRNQAKISYGVAEICRDWDEIINERELIIVGTGETAELVLTELKDWIQVDGHKVNIVSTDVNPFLNKSSELTEFFNFIDEDWEKKRVLFEDKLSEWKSLEDYEKAKIPRPNEPAKKITFYNGYNVTSLDKMIDTDGVYLTIERADFRFAEAPKGNDLKTLPAKRIIVATGYHLDKAKYAGLQINLKKDGSHDEAGFYTLRNKNNINAIKENILSFFTKVEE